MKIQIIVPFILISLVIDTMVNSIDSQDIKIDRKLFIVHMFRSN